MMLHFSSSKVCGWKREKSSDPLCVAEFYLFAHLFACFLLFQRLLMEDIKCFWLLLISVELRMLSSQKSYSVITIIAAISILICNEAAQHQHTWVFLLSSGRRLIFLWDYLPYSFMQTIKNIDKLVRFYQKRICLERANISGMQQFLFIRGKESSNKEI